MAVDFEDQDYDLFYCEGDTKLEDLDLKQVEKLIGLQRDIEKLPTEADKDLASVGLLDEMYGDELDVR